MKTLASTMILLKLGKRAILRSFLDLKRLLDKSEFHYHLNRLFIDDYCLYVQSVSRKKIKSLAKEISKVSITKEDIGWNLEELEAKAIERAQQLPDEEEQEE